SVTMPFNIDKAAEIISAIKNDENMKKVKILVGGRVFNDNPELWKNIGADGYASDPVRAKELVERWYK
ncbi:MAG: cobalamin-binding protein, partial [Candidatus Delongbacteria bacterium]|nr:cobalamin-binding protein [Candidatus Delongbacteria bacterium]